MLVEELKAGKYDELVGENELRFEAPHYDELTKEIAELRYKANNFDQLPEEIGDRSQQNTMSGRKR